MWHFDSRLDLYTLRRAAFIAVVSPTLDEAGNPTGQYTGLVRPVTPDPGVTAIYPNGRQACRWCEEKLQELKGETTRI